MSKKMIECPVCHGRRWFVTSIGSINECAKCGTAGRIPDRRKPTIPDRRKPTASDRAVERIKALLETFIAIEKPWDDKDTTAVMVLGIIREEAERG